ncbi:hypothetical protein [Nocardiopsis sp. JB363]|uniref:hypothetical protein n=1 Tax=Nocardiopsis sp. JB363 TaxID=1434837 RepID=UPI001180F6CB|nr:hypothetical protein [Nocardiopsis sp. JB363]
MTSSIDGDGYADTVLDDATAWGMAQLLARQAVYRTRVLARRERRDLHLPVSVDLTRAVLVWLVWDQSRGRIHREHPGTRIRAAHWPTVVPEHATPYQRSLLEPLLHAGPQEQDDVVMAVRMIVVADLTLIDEDTDRAGDGEPLVSMTISGMTLTGADGVVMVACPVCRRDTPLQLIWDGYIGTASCPDGHGEWTTGIGPIEWPQIMAMGTWPTP